MTGVVGTMRRGAGAAKRRLFPSPERKAWLHACRTAARTPRYERGRITLAGYDLDFPDLLTLCPQWYDIFVDGSLDFQSSTAAPRILDCGANVGLASLYFKRRYPAARITAFEADPAIAALLEGNLRRNGAADVEVRRAAVWTGDGDVSFRAEGADAGAIDGVGLSGRGAVVRVAAVRLADVIAQEPVDLLKLDVEGAEAAVLADCELVLSGVRALILDLHEFDPARRQAPVVLDCLRAAGFDYSVGALVEMPDRPPVAGAATPFPGRAMCWAMTVRAWRR